MITKKINNYDKAIFYTNEALRIRKRKKTYVNEIFSWNYIPYDVLAISYFYLGDIDTSINYAHMALEMEPDNENLINNLDIIKKYKDN